MKEEIERKRKEALAKLEMKKKQGVICKYEIDIDKNYNIIQLS